MYARWIRTLAMAILFLAAASTDASARAPDWLEELLELPLSEYSINTQAISLLHEIRTVVRADGEVRSYHRRVFRILRPEGVRRATIALNFDDDTRITDLKGWNLKPDGIEHEVDQDDAVETQLLTGSTVLFSDTRSLLLRIPEVEVGSVIAFEFERRHRPYVLQDDFAFQQTYPSVLARFELELPDDWDFDFRLVNYPEVVPDEVERRHWVWEFRDTSALTIEPNMPPASDVGARLLVNFFRTDNEIRLVADSIRSWDDVAGWFNRLAEPRYAASASVSEEAQRLGNLEAAARFVQSEVRYVAIEIGIGGFQPHFAGDILTNRYGDCKDKVTLLRSLNAVLGRDVFPVLIDTGRRRIIEEFPSPSYFNHLIAAIRIAPGEFTGPAVIEHPELGSLVLFDPTDSDTPLGRLPRQLEGINAVVMTEDTAHLIDTPVSGVLDNRQLWTGSFEIQPDGGLVGELTELAVGGDAILASRRLEGERHEDWIRTQQAQLARNLPGLVLDQYTVTGLGAADDFVRETTSFAAPGFGQVSGDLMLVQPSLRLEAVPRVDEEERVHPYLFANVGTRTVRLSYRLPAGYEVESLPEVRQVDTPFVKYRMEVSVDDDNLVYSSSYQTLSSEVPPEEIAILSGAFDTLRRALTSFVVLKRVESDAGTQQRSTPDDASQ